MMELHLKRKLAFALVPIALLAGCAAPQPPGPHVAVMPAPGKPFEVFAAEDQYCRGYAEQSTGGANAADASAQSVAGSAVAGTLIGAAAGSVLLGRRSGAATGAGMGLIVGTSAGASQGAISARDIQRRYDIAYQQCMYAKGNQIPGFRAVPSVSAPAVPQYAPPPPPSYPPTYPPTYPQQSPPQYPPQGNYPPPPPPAR
jgi:hypothetical protein